MFGFGMSPRDKWHLNQVEMMIAPIALSSGQDVKTLARQFFDSTKEEAVKRMGENAYIENYGEKVIANKKELVEKRLAAGLTVDDIRNYWNQTPLMLEIQSKFLEMSDFMALNVAQQLGKSDQELQAIVAGWRKTRPRWGDPEQWNPTLPVNIEFSAIDADLYIEFYLRVNRWQERTPETVQNSLLKNFTSFNAMLRNLIKDKKL